MALHLSFFSLATEKLAKYCMDRTQLFPIGTPASMTDHASSHWFLPSLVPVLYPKRTRPTGAHRDRISCRKHEEQRRNTHRQGVDKRPKPPNEMLTVPIGLVRPPPPTD